VIYKWHHSRTILAGALTEKYAAAVEAGWEVTDAEIQRDVSELLGGGFHRFLSGARVRAD
jgi:hypothetical protein